MESLKARLLAEIQGEVLFDEPLRRYTTYRIGGPAEIFVAPATEEDAITVLRCTHEAQVPLFVMGSGSNLLISEAGVSGVVMRLGPRFGAIAFSGDTVYAQAGASLPKLAKVAADRGLGGLEWAGGVPGTVGGAVTMNAGAHGSETSRVLAEVHLAGRDGSRRKAHPSELGYTYRKSRILDERSHVVLGARFRLEPGDPKAIKERMKGYAARRRRTQPLGLPSSGSVFKNPPGHHAGRLIEAASLKGVRIGGAEISSVHGNFIVNTGGATADDVMALIQLARRRVKEEFGIDLELEVELVGWDRT